MGGSQPPGPGSLGASEHWQQGVTLGARPADREPDGRLGRRATMGRGFPTMDLLGYFRMLRRRWVLILALTVAGGALGVASTLVNSDSASGKAKTYYKATSTLVLDTTGQNAGGFQSAFTNLDQIAILTTTGDVPGAVAQKLGVDEKGLTDHIVTTTNGSTNALEITAAEPTAGDAVAVADTFSDQLIADLTKRDTDRYNAQRDYLSNRINTLTGQVNTLTGALAANPNDRVIAAQLNTAQNELGNTLTEFGSLTATGPPASRLSVLQKAQAVPINQGEYDSRLNLGALGQNHLNVSNSGTDQPTLSASSSSSALDGKLARGIFGALVGFLAGVGLALLLERLNRRIRTHEDAEEAFNLPVLAEVPRISRSEQAEIVAAAAPLSRAAEAFRAVRSSLLFARATMVDEHTGAGIHRDGDTKLFEPDHNEPLVIMVASAAPAEGKTTTAANLAAVFAESGQSVLVVNCDFRRPSIHKIFGVEDEPRRVHETRVPNVKIVTNVLTDPATNPSQVVAAQRQVIAAARGRFDVILLDTAPLLTANDAIELVGSADLVLLVARSEQTSFDSAKRASDLLQRLDAPLAGVVLCAVKGATNDYYYYYQPGRVDPVSSGPTTKTPSGASSNGNGTGSATASAVESADDMFVDATDAPPSSS
jgi:Mrp family chromosome partitioning ATPase/capsular polysaccharide biosynthesis protein